MTDPDRRMPSGGYRPYRVAGRELAEDTGPEPTPEELAEVEERTRKIREVKDARPRRWTVPTVCRPRKTAR